MFSINWPPALLVLTGVMLTVAIWRDFRFHRIDNWITFPATFLAILLHFYSTGWSGLVDATLGMTLGLLLLLPFYVFGGMAAGDVKLMAAVGAILGVQSIVWATLYTLVAGSVLALVLLLAKGELTQGLSHMRQQIWGFACTRVWVPASSIPSKADSSLVRRFPYAAAIACGCLMFAFLGAPRGL